MTRRMRISYTQLGVVLLSILATTVRADQWPLPTTKTYLSRDQTWRLTVTPRPVVSQLAYFQDKAAKREGAGAPPGNSQKTARGLMEHLEQGRWRVVWNEPLLNEVSPVEAIVSSSGQIVTFDNWHGTGYGKNVVVIYDLRGKPVRSMGLGDFLPKQYMDALPRSVSSIFWGDRHYLSADDRQLVLRVVVPSVASSRGEDAGDPRYVELPFNLTTGKAILPDPNTWSDALADVARVNAANLAADAKFAVEFVAPLRAPVSTEEGDWYAYLLNAFYRVDAAWDTDFPAIKILRSPQEQNYQSSVSSLEGALHDELNKDGAIMIASPSQDNLVRVLSDVTATVPPGWLKNARVYVAVDDAHTTAVAKALAPTGAKYIQLDLNKPIPQRRALLDSYRSKH